MPVVAVESVETEYNGVAFACEHQDVSRFPRMQLVAGFPATQRTTMAKVKLGVQPGKRLRNTHALHVIVFPFSLPLPG